MWLLCLQLYYKAKYRDSRNDAIFHIYINIGRMKEMSSVLKIGNLTLNVGNMSHVLGVTKNNVDTYLKYATYQSSFEKGSK